MMLCYTPKFNLRMVVLPTAGIAQAESPEKFVQKRIEDNFSKESEEKRNLIERMYDHETDNEENAERIHEQPEIQEPCMEYGYDERDVPGRIAAGDSHIKWDNLFLLLICQAAGIRLSSFCFLVFIPL